MSPAHEPLTLNERSPIHFAARAEARARTQEGQLFLRFQIPAARGRSGLAMMMRMGCIQEVLSLPVQRLSPMPNMPSCMLGLMNRGNRIFWLVDLGLLLGLSRLEPNAQQHSVMILRSGSTALGIAVQQVENMQWLNLSQVRPKPVGIDPSLSPYISSAVEIERPDLAAGGSIDSGDETLLILDADAILQAPVLRSLVVQ